MTIILKHINESNQDRLIRKTSEDLIPDDIPLKYYNLLTGNFDKDFRRRHKFQIKVDTLPAPKVIYIKGSFDGWKDIHEMKLDSYDQSWSVYFVLESGTYR